jgi:hypothetical protein
MNCKQGDMAIIIKSRWGNEGKIVTCLELMGEIPGYYGIHWMTDRLLPCEGITTPFINDAFLRPIRPSDEPDEMLKITGLPVDRKIVA